MDSFESGFKYLKTIVGMLKILEIVLSLLAFICAMLFTTSWAWSLMGFFNTVVLIALCYAGSMIIFHVTHCTSGFSAMPWDKVECISCIIVAILLFISSSLFIYYNKPTSLEAAVFFGFADAFVFIINAIYKIVYSWPT